MKFTEFSEKTMVTNVTAPWAQYMDDGDFVSYLPSYVGGAYRKLFTKNVFTCETVGDITYYVYNPISHGADKNGKYPLLMWIHGATNSFDGEICITHCGGELYASPEYQEKMGGAFIVVPIANEKRQEDGMVTDGWSTDYAAPVKTIIDTVCEENPGNISYKFVMGGSSGGYFSWLLAETYPNDINACIPISSGYVPGDEALTRIENAGVHVLVAHGRYDELADFNKFIAPHEKKLSEMKNCICYFPKWVRNGDKGIASLNFGFEMGQHCLINQFQANLMFVDGTCYDERFPDGVTGWIKKTCEELNNQ